MRAGAGAGLMGEEPAVLALKQLDEDGTSARGQGMWLSLSKLGSQCPP